MKTKQKFVNEIYLFLNKRIGHGTIENWLNQDFNKNMNYQNGLEGKFNGDLYKSIVNNEKYKIY